MEDYSKLSKKELMERLVAKESMPAKNMFSDSENELAKIDRLASVANPHQIPFKQTNDHKNVMLYTALNKRVGPLHPYNARRAMDRWRRAGIQLYVSPRTPEQIETFKNTEEYKKYIVKHEATRATRRAQSSKGKTEKMIKDIAIAVAGAKSNVE